MQFSVRYVLGSSILVLGTWILNDPMFSFIFNHSGNFIYILTYSFLAAGCLILLCALFACYGAIKGSKCFLGAFVFTLILTLSLEIVTVSWVLENKDRFADIVRVSVKQSIQEEYGLISTTTVMFDVIQKHLRCCGADGPSDWTASLYNNIGREDIIDIAFSSLNIFFNIPESCCDQNVSEITCEIARKQKLDAVYHAGIYEEGCVTKLTQIISDNYVFFFSFCMGIIALEVVAIGFSLVMCFTRKGVTNKLQNVTKT